MHRQSHHSKLSLISQTLLLTFVDAANYVWCLMIEDPNAAASEASLTNGGTDVATPVPTPGKSVVST